jgi:hypothetical protein
MTHQLNSRDLSPRRARWVAPSLAFAVLVAVLVALLGLGGCTAYATKKNLPIDCSVENAYDIDNIDSEFGMSWSSHDGTTDAGFMPAVQTIPDGALCTDTTAFHVTSLNYYNDWGAVFGFYGFGKKIETARQGLSFWARAPGNTNKGLTILIDDPNTYNPSASCTDAGMVVPPGDAGANCTTYCLADGGSTATGPVLDPNGNVLSSGTSTAPLPANSCGNSYQTQLTLTADWHFYTIPFSAFHQMNNPDKVPNAALTETGSAEGTYLLTSSIWNMTFRVPKAAPFDLWFDRLGFYSPRTPGEGPTDAQ